MKDSLPTKAALTEYRTRFKTTHFELKVIPILHRIAHFDFLLANRLYFISLAIHRILALLTLTAAFIIFPFRQFRPFSAHQLPNDPIFPLRVVFPSAVNLLYQLLLLTLGFFLVLLANCHIHTCILQFGERWG
jgi:hypothetical protein